MVRIGSQVAPPRGSVRMHECDFRSLLFYFLIQPTGRCYYPIRTLDASNDVVRGIHVACSWFEAFDTNIKGSPAQKNPKFWSQFGDFQVIFSQKTPNMGPSESKHALNVEIHPQNFHF